MSQWTNFIHIGMVSTASLEFRHIWHKFTQLCWLFTAYHNTHRLSHKGGYQYYRQRSDNDYGLQLKISAPSTGMLCRASTVTVASSGERVSLYSLLLVTTTATLIALEVVDVRWPWPLTFSTENWQSSYLCALGIFISFLIFIRFYRAMHVVIQRGIAIVSRPSVCDVMASWAYTFENNYMNN